jgi:hypothetical protein
MWGWRGNSADLDSCEGQLDRGDGKGYGLLAYDTMPGYTDTQAFPTTRHLALQSHQPRGRQPLPLYKFSKGAILKQEAKIQK